MTDYKTTLNLPHTDFPMKASLAQREPQLLQRWESMALYQELRALRAGKPKFILHEGPPYANGSIHIGHAVNRTLKDIIVKAKNLSGFDAPLVPGWDCHGLPIELNVEKTHGKAGVKLTPAEFRAHCRAYAREQIAVQRDELKRLGLLADWEHAYATMDFKFEANIVRALAQLIAKGHLQRGFKPVHWCIDCGSALAEAEVEYADKTSLALDVKFRVLDIKDFSQRMGITLPTPGIVSVPIWTTTPWTLPANEAVALHPAIEYILVEVKDTTPSNYLLLATQLLPSCLARFAIANYTILGACTGAALAGLQLQHPFYARHVPIILGEHVTTETGTGAVHTAPAHGQEDYAVSQRYQLPLVNPVGDDGKYLPEVPLFAGEHVFKVHTQILDVLRQQDNILCEQKFTHSYPHCWRHKIPLIFRATPQWFISMDQQGLRAAALQMIEQVQWIPARGKARIASMIDGRPDWCISRQRIWCAPITLFVHKQTDELHPATLEFMERAAQLIEHAGIDAWAELDKVDFLGADAADYRKVTDTLDVWFNSGITHFAVLQQRADLAYPADLYLEGSDQHRGWFQSSLLTAVGMHGTAPFKAVLTHGFTVDEKGRKMSKSLGNVIAPQKVIEQFGADILRLWIASTDYRNEMTVSPEILQRAAEAYRRIRNTMRFLLANLHEFDANLHAVPFAEMLALDQQMLLRAHVLQTEIQQAYTDYQFHLIYQKLQHFCSLELGGFYLDIIKDRQYTMQRDSRGRRSAQTALYHIAEAMVRWLAPILSFTAEEIWGYLPNRTAASVFLTEWYALPAPAACDVDVVTKSWTQLLPSLLEIREAVNKQIEQQRAAGLLGANLEAEVDIYFAQKTNSALYNALTALSTTPQQATQESELRFVLITSRADVHQLAELPADTEQFKINYAGAVHLISVRITPATQPKCVRCWHRRAEVGATAAHPELCGRCVTNVSDTGENRSYA